MKTTGSSLRPVPMTSNGNTERVDGNSREEDILRALADYGIRPDAVTLWGTGRPMHEFLWSEEMADLIMKEIGFQGELRGMPQNPMAP